MIHCQQTVKESFRPEVLQIKSPRGLAVMTSYHSEAAGDGPEKNRGFRTEPYQLIEYYEVDKEYELYDLQNDRGEIHNLYPAPRFAHLTQQLMRRMEALRQETARCEGGMSDELSFWS